MATPLNLTFKEGYSSIYYLAFEGIPYLFVEKIPLRVDDDGGPTAMSGRTTVKGLVIDESSTLSMECDREAGVGRGAAVTFTLAYKDMEEAGLLDDIFSRPSLETEVSADVSATATTMTADTTGFDASGTVYFGRELITYTGVGGGSSFTGCTRGVVGYPYLHEASSVSQSRKITDKPLIWRGRFATLYESIVDREGRIVDSQWGTGDYTREIWKGYVEKQPRPGTIGMEIECLPLCRLLGNEIGYSVKWQDNRTTEPIAIENTGGSQFPPFYDDSEGFVTVTITFTGSTAGSATSPVTVTVAQATKQSFTSYQVWAQELAADIVTAVNTVLPEFYFQKWHFLQPLDRLGVSIQFNATGSVGITALELTILPATAPYFLLPVMGLTSEYGGNPVIELEFKNRLDAPDDYPYLIVNQITGEGSQDYDIIAPGIGILSNGDVQEVVKWDSYISLVLGRIAIRLSERGVGGSPIADICPEGFTLESGVGATETVEKNILTILESSGSAGVRGTYDTLSLGFGLGIPEAFIDLVELSEMPFADYPAEIIQSAKSDVTSLLGGWIAVANMCLINYRVSGVIKLKPVATALADFSSKANNCTELTASDVLLAPLEPVDVVDPPNPVIIDTGSLTNEGAKVTVRDSVAIQECGARSVELKCPGMSSDTARKLAPLFIYLGAGQYAVRITVGPWVDVQPGDPIILAISHPGIYDWEAGTTTTASAPGRVMGWSRDLVTNRQTLTVLLNSLGGDASLLCPVAIVASESGGTLTLTSGVGWLTEGESVILYNVGEPTEMETKIIDTISGNDVTFTTAISAFVGANTRITFPNVSAASSEQDDFFFKTTSYKWSG